MPIESSRIALSIGAGFTVNGDVLRKIQKIKVACMFPEIFIFAGCVGRIINRIIRSIVLYLYGAENLSRTQLRWRVFAKNLGSKLFYI